MAESTDSKPDTTTELATMKEQMAEIFQVLKALQSEKEKNAAGGPRSHPGSGNPNQGAGTSQPQDGQDTDTKQKAPLGDDSQRTPPGGNAPHTEKEAEKLSSIEERLKAIEGSSCTDLKNAFEMCLVPDVVLPPKFKVREFEKYNETTCPKSHLHMYARKMSAYHENDKLLIYCFQDSLYKFNEDAAPDRTQLQNMVKKPSESLREYVQRWRGLASQEKSWKVESRVERLLKKVQVLPEEGSGSVKKPAFMKKKDVETHFIAAEPKRFQPRHNNQNNYRAPSRFAQNHIQNQNTTPNQTPIHNPPNQNTYQPRQGYTQQPRNDSYYQQERRAPVFDRIPMTYTDLFAYLQRQGMITPILGRIPANPGPWYNENVTCAYHSGVPGHLVEDCKAFKFKVQDLINAKRIDFRETRPNSPGNPLPNHENQEVNAIEARDEVAVIDEVEDMKMPMGFIFREMCRQGLVEVITPETHSKETKSCEMHGCVGHSLEDCEDFKLLLQKMMDLKLIAIGGCSPRPEINVIKKSQEETHVFIRTYEPMEPVITSEGSPFPYESDKAVPWVYKEETTMSPSVVTNIAGNSRITRTGRIYVPPEVERGPSRVAKGKEKVLEHIEEDIEVALPEGVSHDEACEFLKFIKQMLNQAHVSHDITTDKLGGIVNNIVADNYLSFHDEEIPAEGTGHVRPLHISVMCNDCVIGKVLLDNGSSLNVMTKRTFSRFPVDTSYLRASSMIVKGFDGSRRDLLVGTSMDSFFRGNTLHLASKSEIHSKWTADNSFRRRRCHGVFDTRYIEVTEEALETSFQGLEIANTTVVIEGAPLVKPYLSDVSLMMEKVMIRGGYKPGSGLGKYGQGSKEIIIPKANKGRYGLVIDLPRRTSSES
ncbi:PREDICTED: uncharacterized protein LOC109356229 [Lupinus angustifolius]|uniref:uncharacterized protein LOC109356229 n=1 Tax=Lupinus angustifolius TaxID=3871 RepID=UPI00092F25D5|nr:PREDICTED: uncharacterized protein LOC109356229 [Lupinus angustifolius]